jgi:hypothetical protein
MCCAGSTPVVKMRKTNSTFRLSQLALKDCGTNGAGDGEGGVADLEAL